MHMYALRVSLTVWVSLTGCSAVDCKIVDLTL